MPDILALRKQHPDDAEFLDLPEVRKAYWKAVGIRSWEHKIVPLAMQLGVPSTVCQKCRKDGIGKCTVPDPIPPLLEAVEELRKKVAERVRRISRRTMGTDVPAYVAVTSVPVENFIVFLMALMEEG